MKFLFTEAFGFSSVSFCFTLIYNVEYCMEFLLFSVRREAVDTLILNLSIYSSK